MFETSVFKAIVFETIVPLRFIIAMYDCVCLHTTFVFALIFATYPNP
ncbi:hypothetical protein HMPREF3208_00410 [Gardnerella vaginalis]|uniref:Uncharacterized protein n=1 Tax=Gardnerella vaginalis TaxID=2702 RepID=A0A133P0U4_GARVA|nr:hypothetical protein HMPREF3208_00410 [Gardnerella vaginalis]